MAKRISELPYASTPLDPDTLLEVATPNDSSPSGYVSERVHVSDISNGGGSGGLPHRFVFSGEAEPDGDGEWSINVASYTELRELLGYSFDVIGTMSIEASISVRSTGGNPTYGSMRASIISNPGGYSYITYLLSAGVYSTEPYSMPYIPETRPWYEIPPLIQRVEYNEDGSLEIIVRLITSGPIPSNIQFQGYIDITFMEFVPGT